LERAADVSWFITRRCQYLDYVTSDDGLTYEQQFGRDLKEKDGGLILPQYLTGEAEDNY
jgi:hypothetical protein